MICTDIRINENHSLFSYKSYYDNSEDTVSLPRHLSDEGVFPESRKYRTKHKYLLTINLLQLAFIFKFDFKFATF